MGAIGSEKTVLNNGHVIRSNVSHGHVISGNDMILSRGLIWFPASQTRGWRVAVNDRSVDIYDRLLSVSLNIRMVEHARLVNRQILSPVMWLMF